MAAKINKHKVTKVFLERLMGSHESKKLYVTESYYTNGNIVFNKSRISNNRQMVTEEGEIYVDAIKNLIPDGVEVMEFSDELMEKTLTKSQFKLSDKENPLKRMYRIPISVFSENKEVLIYTNEDTIIGLDRKLVEEFLEITESVYATDDKSMVFMEKTNPTAGIMPLIIDGLFSAGLIDEIKAFVNVISRN